MNLSKSKGGCLMARALLVIVSMLLVAGCAYGDHLQKKGTYTCQISGSGCTTRVQRMQRPAAVTNRLRCMPKPLRLHRKGAPTEKSRPAAVTNRLRLASTALSYIPTTEAGP